MININRKIDILLNNESFEVCDENIAVKNKDIIQYISTKSKFLRKFNKSTTIVLIKDNCGVFFWLNILTCVKLNLTCFPVSKNYKLNEIKKYYKNIITLYGKKNFLIKNDHVIKNNNIKKFNFISATSGSTGKPKLTLLNFDHILTNTKEVKNFCNLKRNKSYLIAIPGYFFSSILHFFTSLVAGTKFIYLEKKLFPVDLINNLIKFQVNYFGGPPIHSKWIIENKKNIHSIEKIFSSGDFLEQSVIKKFLNKKKNFDFYYMYGITEASGRVCINNLKKTTNTNSVGKPLKLYKIFFQDGDDIYINSKNLFFGYFVDNKFHIHNSKTYYTGDKGCEVKSQNIVLQGRKDDVFKSSGVKVFTQKIKNALLETNYFREVFVFKTYLKNYGNVPACAYETPKKIDPNKILNKLETKLDPLHLPKNFVWYKKIPRLRNNKIDRIKIYKNEKINK